MNIRKHIPNVITIFNLLGGCVGVISVFNNDLFISATFILIAGIFDFLDGFFARILKVQSPLGIQLDSLADLLSFGLLPSLIYFKLISGLSGGFYPYISLIIVVASAFRLARFNIDEGQKYFFRGLPTPANAFFTAGLVFIYLSGWKSFDMLFAQSNYLAVLVIVQSFFLNSNIRFLSLKFVDFRWRGNELRFLVILTGIFFLVFLRLPGIFFVILSYIIISLIYHIRSIVLSGNGESE